MYSVKIFEVNYTPKNVRFVTKGKNLYAFVLVGQVRNLIIKSLTASPQKKRRSGKYFIIEESDIKSVHLIGYESPLKWQLTSEGLKIQTPSVKPCEHAYAFKITWTE